ncbi:T-cell immunoglobulin and mucin domain-containing protein 4 [Saccopteryx leptura]|uniref:T-cell immunoglobulin and mucin domain-containing protein 4 n=1 Tax=Saccopteryx leptura TaxID=249018 RepID=UPI00339C985C
MSQGPLVLWLLTWLWVLHLTPAATETVVTAFLGQSVTLPCMHASWSQNSNSMCWGRGWCPKSKCNEEILHTDGARVLTRKSAKYELQGDIRRGDVSLTIFNTNEGDSIVYCCRIEVPGWFNDVKKNIRLKLSEAPPTTHRPTTTTTAVTTTTTMLPTTVVTTPDLTTGTPLQTRTTAALTTMTTTCPLTTPQTGEPSTEGPTLTAEPETSLVSEVTARDTALLTSKESKPWVLQSTAQPSTWEMTSETILVHNEVEPEQIRGVDSFFLLKIIASSLGFVLCALIVAFLLRGKVTKTNCFQKHTRLNNTGDSKNVLDGMQHGREDEDGLFTL